MNYKIKLSGLALMAALSSAQLTGCAQTDPNAFVSTVNGQHIYLRGSFNGWDTSSQFKAIDKGILVATVNVSPGSYGFKVASEDWSFEWVVNPDSNEIIMQGTRYTLTEKKAPEDSLFAGASGTYQFKLDVNNVQKPVLTVQKMKATQSSSVNPHMGRVNVITKDYPTYDGKSETVTYSVAFEDAALRDYSHSTTLTLRDPGPQYKKYKELADQPYVRTGSLEFDALFALSINEMKALSVDTIRDGNYNGGASIDCKCFKTGEKWAYVWTRDLAYAAHLNLATLDPQRVKNSLDFKISKVRPEVPVRSYVNINEGYHLVQDTGSGGSWPVSTDRVTWAFGAEQVLNTLQGTERSEFAIRTLSALKNTLEIDRQVAYDPLTGLYTGEQSFLDWREQTYPNWIVDDIASMASSKALSTNVAHYQAMKLAAQLATEHNLHDDGKRYTDWATALKSAINQHLWQADMGLYSSTTAGHFDNAVQSQYDWLGQSLAVITGVAEGKRAQQVLENYPHGPMGAPVVFPQKIDVPVYHNRALWPFVTAYGLNAASQIKHVSVANAAYKSLIRGTATNLSNMENLEWLSGQPMLLQRGASNLSGPVINSNYQLWSVAGYLNMVTENVFGLKPQAKSLKVEPFITTELHRTQFAGSRSIELKQFKIHDKLVEIKINLPRVSRSEGFYPVRRVKLNGLLVNNEIPYDELMETLVESVDEEGVVTRVQAMTNVIEVDLGYRQMGLQRMTEVTADPQVVDEKVYAPLTPRIKRYVIAGYDIKFDIEATQPTSAPEKISNQAVLMNVYRNGDKIASAIEAGEFVDPLTPHTACYSVSAVFASGNESLRSRPVCIGKRREFKAGSNSVESNVAVTHANHAVKEPHLKNWGKPEDYLKISGIKVKASTRHAFQIKYHNDAHVIGQGITAAVKWLRVFNKQGEIVAEGTVQMPHVKPENLTQPLVYSTPLYVVLKQGEYSVEVLDYFNMSYLASNEQFSHKGGKSGVYNRFDFASLKVTPIAEF